MNPFRVVGVIGKRRDPDLVLLGDLCQSLQKLDCEVLLERNPALQPTLQAPCFDRETLARRCDLVIVVGGDGTLLDAGRALAPAGLPLLGVNQGRLGFMVDVAPETMHEHLAAIIGGQCVPEDRMILSAVVKRAAAKDSLAHLAVNDVVIRNQATIRMIEFETWLDDEFISNHRADGVIVASPTGSTSTKPSSAASPTASRPTPPTRGSSPRPSAISLCSSPAGRTRPSGTSSSGARSTAP